MLLTARGSQYGCWCDITNNLSRSSTEPPVNQLDAECKSLHHNYNCIQIDDPNCDGRTLGESDYAVSLSVLSSSVNIETQCALDNSNTCGERTCIAEAYFLRQTYAPVFANDVNWINMWNDVTYQHSSIGGQFDYSACRAAQSGGPNGGCGPNGCGARNVGLSSKQCCGDYPQRIEYSADRQMCCDGLIESIGTC